MSFCVLCRFAIVAADASAARSILVFKHDEDKVECALTDLNNYTHRSCCTADYDA
jgi:hypothetical protein